MNHNYASPRTAYEDLRQQHQTRLTHLRACSNRCFVGKITCFLLFATSLYVAITHPTILINIGVLLSAIGYGASVLIDLRIVRQLQHTRSLLQVIDEEIGYCAGKTDTFPTGNEYIDPTHPYSFDLDLFGARSLFQRINRTTSPVGSNRLAKQLTELSDDPKEIHRRKETIDELTTMTDLRIDFRALGLDRTSCEKESIQKLRSLNLPRSFDSSIAHLLLWISPISLLLLLLATIFTTISPGFVGLLFVVQLGITLPFASKLFQVASQANSAYAGFKAFARQIHRIEVATIHTALGQELRGKLCADTLNAQKAITDLASILEQLDARNNAFGTFLFNGLILRDLFLIRQLNRWVDHYAPHADSWIDAGAEFETLSSFATFQFNHPTFVPATLHPFDPQNSSFQAHELYHPFIAPDEAIANPLSLTNASFAIITGANMAGKSTYLRAVGINMILALNGVNVAASSFTMPVVALFTGMRNSDNLTSKQSYFQAELIRMEQLIAYVKSHPHTFIILDEILKGTNSADKLEGSKLLLKKLSQLPASGLIATHDLALTALAKESNRYPCLRFEIELTDPIRYTYQISQGVAQNMNATYLLRSILNEQ